MSAGTVAVAKAPQCAAYLYEARVFKGCSDFRSQRKPEPKPKRLLYLPWRRLSISFGKAMADVVRKQGTVLVPSLQPSSLVVKAATSVPSQSMISTRKLGRYLTNLHHAGDTAIVVLDDVQAA